MSDIKRAKRMLWLFSVFKIPLIGFVSPKLVELSSEKMVVKIPLRWRTKNHLQSMYFGALAIGADLAGAFQAFYVADKRDHKISIVFKNFNAEFLKRPESDVYFVSEAGTQIEKMIDETTLSKERVTETIKINAIINYSHSPEVVAEFELGLSVKAK